MVTKHYHIFPDFFEFGIAVGKLWDWTGFEETLKIRLSSKRS